MTTMTPEQFQAHITKPRKGRYRAKKVKADGYTFDSQTEHERYCLLKIMRDTGMIRDLIVHPKLEMASTVKTLDFSYIEVGRDGEPDKRVYEDVKGYYDAKDKRFIKEVEAVHGMHIDIVTKRNGRWDVR